MAFDFEWTGRNPANEQDRQRGIDAAQEYASRMDIDPAKAWQDFCDGDFMDSQRDDWNGIEFAAVSALADGWHELPENVSLIWI